MSCPINPLIEECKRLRKSVLPISVKYHGVTEQISAKNTMYPFVLLLGNHSSGKSSFINHILKRKVQMTGVAPTDDNFTIIGPGEADIDRNGPALVGDPDLGFSALKSFGPVLVNHTQLKVRSDTAIKDFMIVDSPGMIDSPVTDKTPSDGPVGMDRGYNFEGVCRWYAERADVILLFFDPDKPGTTGETLSILTTALVGLDHKLYIILNKADQFNRIHDFARAYGSLCWNLSKVIPRKDLPRIHTMCLPAKVIAQDDKTPSEGNSPLTLPDSVQSPSRALTPSPTLIMQQTVHDPQSFISASPPVRESPVVIAPVTSKSFFEQGSSDLEESRAEIEMETFNAPRRRIDNEISRLTEAISALLMHCNIIDKVTEMYENRVWRARGLSAAVLVASIGLTIGVNYLCDALLPSTANDVNLATKESAGSSKTGIPQNTKPTSSASSGGNTLRSTRAGSAVVTASVVGSNSSNPASAVAAQGASILDAMWDWRSKLTIMGWTAMTGLLSTVGVITHEHYTMKAMLETFNDKQTYERIYQQIYQKEIAAENESVIALGKIVLDAIPANVNAEAIRKMRRVDKVEFSALHRILNEDIANLRRRASPSFPVLGAAKQRTTPRCSSDNLVGMTSRPSLDALDRVPYKSHRASINPDLHVHFSPSTTNSPITTKENGSKKKSVILLGFEDSSVAPEDFATFQLQDPLAVSGPTGSSVVEVPVARASEENFNKELTAVESILPDSLLPVVGEMIDASENLISPVAVSSSESASGEANNVEK